MSQYERLAENVIVLPTERCAWCGTRIRPGEITVNDEGKVYHAQHCWPEEVAARHHLDGPPAS
jgi:hypothetical protein